jgi:hypothetical protein
MIMKFNYLINYLNHLFIKVMNLDYLFVIHYFHFSHLKLKFLFLNCQNYLINFKFQKLIHFYHYFISFIIKFINLILLFLIYNFKSDRFLN